MNKPSSPSPDSFFEGREACFCTLAFMDHLIWRYLEKSQTHAKPVSDHLLKGLLPYLLYCHEKGHADFVVRHMVSLVQNNVQIEAVSEATFSFACECIAAVTRRGHPESLRLLENMLCPAYRPRTALPLFSRLVALRLRSLCHQGIRQVALFGLGKHTQWISRRVEVPGSLRIAAILDDYPVCSTVFPVQTIATPADVDPHDYDAVILSTDRFQPVFRERLQHVWGDKTPRLIDLYEHLPPGPYPKDVFANDMPHMLRVAVQHEIWTLALTLLRVEQEIKRVALFGAGAHTGRMDLDALAARSGVEIVVVLDDRPSAVSPCLGRPILTPERADPTTFDAVLLSTDHPPEALVRRCRTVFPRTLPVVNVYE